MSENTDELKGLVLEDVLADSMAAYYTELCEKAREEALQLMIKHGKELGCNAIINMRYDANEVMNGLTEVLAYGTAVVVEKIED